MKSIYAVLILALFAGQALSKIITETNEVNDIYPPSKVIDKEEVSNVEDKEVCEFCVAAFAHFKDVLGTYQSQLKNALNNFCKITGGYSGECQALINQYFDKIFNLIMSQFDSKEFCNLLTLCPGIAENRLKDYFGSLRGESCDICKEISTVVKTEIKKEGNKDVVKNLLKEVCSLAGPLKTECNLLIDVEFNNIYAQLVILLDNFDACAEIGICPKVQTRTYDMSEKCKVCEEVIGTLKMVLGNSAARTEIKEAISALCAETGPIAAECKVAVNLVFDSAFKYLLNILNPYTLCREISACPSNSTIGKSHIEKSNECLFCVEIIDVAKFTLNNTELRQKIRAVIEALITRIPKIGSLVEQYFDKYFDVVYDQLLNLINDDEICSDFGACSTTKLTKFHVKTTACTVCKVAAHEIKSELAKKSVQGFLKTELLDVCKKFNSSKCSTYIDSYFDLAYQLITQTLNLESVCEAVHVCPSSEDKQSIVGSGEFCSLCQMGFTEVYSELSKNSTKAEIKAELIKTCSLVGSYSATCQNLVGSYYDSAYNLALAYLNPNVICAELKMCPSVATNSTRTSFIKHGELCQICELGLQEVKVILSENTTEASIKNELMMVCQYFGAYSSECNTYVNAYFQVAYNMALSYLEPNTVCPEIGLCQNNLKPNTVQASLTCKICEEVTSLFSSKIKSLEAKGEAVVYGEMQKACTMLPSDVDAQCKDFVSVYGPPILQMIVEQYGNPTEICSEIKVC